MNPIFESFTAEQKRLAWEQFSRCERSLKTKVCHHPETTECHPTIVSAHTIPRSSLESISKDGHVYEMRPCFASLLKNGEEYLPRLNGIGEVSTFYGFCAKHDGELFRPFEGSPYTATPEQHHCLLYRAVSREIYEKQTGLESAPDYETVSKMHPWVTREQFQPVEDVKMEHLASLLKLLEIKGRLDSILKLKDFGRVRSFVVMLDRAPSVLCSSFFNALYDFDGKPCQYIFDARKLYPGISLTVVPIKPSGGVAIFSWFDVASGLPEQFCRSYQALPEADRTNALIRMMFEYCGNLALSPTWWEGLASERQSALMERAYHGPVKKGRQPTCLRPDGLHYDDWQPGAAFFR